MTKIEKEILDQYCEKELINCKYLLYYLKDGSLVAIEDLVLGTYKVMDNNFINYHLN